MCPNERLKTYKKHRYLTIMENSRNVLIVQTTAKALCIALLIVVIHAMPALAQSKDAAPKAAPPQKFQDWQLKCEAETKRCYTFQRTDLQTTGQQVLNVVLGNIGPEGKHVVHFTVPLSIYIPPGIALKIDEGEQINVPVHTCTPNGCEAMLDLDVGLLAALESAKASNVAFLDAATRKQITIGVSMAGFKEAYAALRRELSFQ